MADATNNNFTISPSLFIGLGTNGWRILDDIRKLMFEEFGRAGLPCCRFLALETDQGKKADDSFLPHVPKPYEKITPLYITVPSVDVVKKRLHSKTEGDDHIDGMREWLDTRLINRGILAFNAGAGNLRQAGRLCLWENWDMVNDGLDKAISDIKDAGNQMQADAFLRQYYSSRHDDAQIPQSFIDDTPKVYICGTLCGGTCSGAFIDVAYFVKKLLGGDAGIGMLGVGKPKVIGLFTFIDSKNMIKPAKKVHVVNSWTALRELDFYYQGGSRYKVKFPNGLEIDTQNEPFDTVYLESMTNSAGNAFKNENKLNQMCAMNLFTEVVTGMADVKESIRIDGFANPIFMKPAVPSGHLRAFSTFGLSAIWYPRYRISRAINRTLAIGMIDAWLGAALNRIPLEETVREDWNKIYKQSEGSLKGNIKGAHAPFLSGEIDKIFDREWKIFVFVSWGEIESYLSNFPKNNTLIDRLIQPNGEYYRKIITAEPRVTEDLQKAIEKAWIAYLADHTVAETKAYIQLLIQKSQQTEGGLPANLPDSPQLVDFNQEQGVSSNPFGRWLWRQSPKSLSGWFDYLFNLTGWFIFGIRSRKAEEQYRNVVWNTMRQRAKEHLAKIRGYTLRLVLANSAQFLKDLEYRVDKIERRLRLLHGTCKTEMGNLTKLQTASNVLLISQGKFDDLEDDVKLGEAEIMKDQSYKSLRREFIGNHDLASLLENEEIDYLLSLVDKTFHPHSQSLGNKFDIGAKAETHFKSKIPTLVKSSFPYVETVGEWKPVTLANVPNRVFCHNQNAGEQLVDEANGLLANADDYKGETVTLDHLIFFYREVGCLTISDLEIHQFAGKCLETSEKNPQAVCTNFTHQGGENYFNLQRDEDYKRLRWWIDAMRYLAPDLFKKRGETLMLQYQDKNGMKREIPVESQELRKYLEKHKAQTLIYQFQEKLREIGKPEVIQRMEEEVNKLPETDAQARIKMQEKHDQILDEAFKEDKEDSPDKEKKEKGNA